ncbi:LytR C-terminal domain-containing protein [Gemmatimonas aurantiaca]|nr:LytR C-terminal domain-containing protein [Gemmatimonas aurantiaca]
MTRLKTSRFVGAAQKGSSSMAARALETLTVVGVAVALLYSASFAFKATQGASSKRPVAEASLRVQALNACGIRGIGNKVADALKNLGPTPVTVQILDVGNFSVFDIERSFIISRVSNLKEAKMLARELGLAAEDVIYAPLENNHRSIHATVVIGADFQSALLDNLQNSR